MKVRTFGEWLKTQRKLRRMSRSQVERAADIAHSHYSKLENERIPRPQEETRERLHQVFGTSDDDLVAAGILRREVLRSAGGEVVTYEYVDDEPAPVAETAIPGTVPAEVAELLAKIPWTADNVNAVTSIVKALVRSDEREAASSAIAGGTPPATPLATPAPPGAGFCCCASGWGCPTSSRTGCAAPP